VTRKFFCLMWGIGGLGASVMFVITLALLAGAQGLEALSTGQWAGMIGAGLAASALIGALLAKFAEMGLRHFHGPMARLLGNLAIEPPPPSIQTFDAMLEAAAQRLRELAALRATTFDLSATADMGQLLQAIVRRARDLLTADHSLILENIEAHQVVRVLAHTFDVLPGTGEIAYGEGVAGRVARDGQSLVVADYAQWEGRSSHRSALSFRHVLGVPMRWQGRLIGVLNLVSGQNPFTPAHVALAEQFAAQAATAIGNARLYAAANRQAERLAILHEASQAIGRTLDLDRIYQATYDAVGRLMCNEAFAIAVLNDDGQRLEAVFLMDRGQRHPARQVAVEASLAGYMLQCGQPVRFNTAREWPRAVAHYGDSDSVQSVVAVPMQMGEQVFGALATEAYQPYAFSEDDVALLATLANYTAAAIQNARLFQSTHQQLTQLTILHEVARAAFSTPDLDEIIVRALDALHQQVGYPTLCLWLPDPNTRALRLHPAFEKMYAGQIMRGVATAAQGVAGQVALSGQPVRVTDVLQTPNTARLVADTRSVLGVPLQIGERVVGVMNAESPEINAFHAQDERLLTIVAGLLAPIIENARLAEQDRARLTELALLHEIARVSVVAPDFDTGLAQALQVLQKHLQCDILGIDLLDQSGQWVVAHPSYLGAQAERNLQPFPVTEGLIGLAIRARRAVCVEDVTRHPAYRADTPAVRSELIVPLIASDRLIGVINAENKRVAAFGKSEEQLLTVVAGLLAPIIENGRLRMRAEQQARDLDWLVRAQVAASASLDQTQVLTTIVEQLGEALLVTSAFVVEVNETYATTKAEYYSPEARPQERSNDLNVPYPVALLSAPLEALQTGQIIHIRADDAHLSAMERAGLRRYGARSVLKVPLVRRNHTLGYVELRDSRHDRQFAESEMRLAQTLAGNAAAALENARLYAAARRHAEQMRLVNEVGREIGGILEVDRLLAHVSRRLETAFGYYHVKAGLIEREVMVFRARFDERRQVHLPEFRLRLDGPGIIAWVTKNAQSRLTPSVLNDPHFLPHSLLPDTKAEAAAPLLARGKVIGVLDVQSDRFGELDTDTLAVLEALSAQLAVAVENARLFTEARRHAEEVSALLTTTLTVSSSMDLPVRLQAIAHHARQLAKADSCTIYQLAEDGLRLKPKIALDERYIQEIMEDVVMLGEGLIGYVAQKGVGELVNRADLDPRARQIPGTPLSPESLMAVPLSIGQKVTGVMAVYREGAVEFDPHDFELLTSFAAQAAVAIESAELVAKLMERANSLQVAYNELAEMDRLKDEMAQNISHELRTPLTFLKSYLEMLVNGDFGALQPAQEQSLRIVIDKSRALERLVNDITTLQTVTAATLQWQTVDLRELTQAALEGVLAKGRENNLELLCQVTNRPVLVRADPLRLAQVLDNLLGNAVKFTEPGGRIWLRLMVEGHQARVEVQDTGVGIALEYQSRIFERFYQANGAVARRHGGLGLGLAICKRIIEAHDGQVGVKSEPGQGALFFFTLPLLGAPP
jgi:GAF domain-containing protein